MTAWARAELIRAIEPRIIPRFGPRGARGFLAVSSEPRILLCGVFGDTQQEARANYEVAREAWAELAERPEPLIRNSAQGEA